MEDQGHVAQLSVHPREDAHGRGVHPETPVAVAGARPGRVVFQRARPHRVFDQAGGLLVDEEQPCGLVGSGRPRSVGAFVDFRLVAAEFLETRGVRTIGIEVRRDDPIEDRAQEYASRGPRHDRPHIARGPCNRSDQSGLVAGAKEEVEPAARADEDRVGVGAPGQHIHAAVACAGNERGAIVAHAEDAGGCGDKELAGGVGQVEPGPGGPCDAGDLAEGAVAKDREPSRAERIQLSAVAAHSLRTCEHSRARVEHRGGGGDVEAREAHVQGHPQAALTILGELRHLIVWEAAGAVDDLLGLALGVRDEDSACAGAEGDASVAKAQRA